LNFDRVRDGDIGVVEQDLLTVTFAGFADGDQRGHGRRIQMLADQKTIIAKPWEICQGGSVSGFLLRMAEGRKSYNSRPSGVYSD
jgi:hypothetical protein